RLFTVAYGFVFGIAVAVILAFISSRHIKMQSIRLERHFLRNLSARETEQDKRAPVRREFACSLLARDLHLADFEVQPGSPSIGKKLKELDLRRKNGVNVVKIIRGQQHLNIPGGEEHLYPYDKIVVAGTDRQISAFRRTIEELNRTKKNKIDSESREMTLEQFIVEPGSFFVGRSIMQSHIRDKANCLVIGLERSGQSQMNPEATAVFEAEDLVWVVGEREKLQSLLEEVNRKPLIDDRGEWVMIDKEE
ncbi:MAG: TrkA C-terminal domain-containing protein, partial [Bacteroidales bacterium]